MGRSDLPPLRALPRVFLPGVTAEEPIDLPREELDKFRKVLRLREGDQIGVLPNDGSLIRCAFKGRQAIPLSVEHPQTESTFCLTIAQAFPKVDRLETIIRACTEIGVAQFILFPAERSVVKWDEDKRHDKLRRLRAIAQESCEQCFRVRLPEVTLLGSLTEVLRSNPDAIVLSEKEGLERKLERSGDSMTIVIGPEGGWAPRELEAIGNRGVTLGARVLRTDTAGPAAAAMLLLA
jgi:16S rRNA (uracil1498-N3)-methyltransferase